MRNAVGHFITTIMTKKHCAIIQKI